MRVRAEGEEAVRGRLRSSTSVKLSRLGCLSSLTWFACSPSELPLLYPSVCLAVQCTSCYMDVATAFPFVSILNFTAWVIAQQWVPSVSTMVPENVFVFRVLQLFTSEAQTMRIPYELEN